MRIVGVEDARHFVRSGRGYRENKKRERHMYAVKGL